MRAVETPTPKIATCTVTVADRINGRWQCFALPVSAEEAIKCCLAVSRPREWLDWHGPDYEGPLGVCIRRTDDTIVVLYHAAGDPEEARRALAELLDEHNDEEWGILS